jgi:hypothetical protein
VDRVTSPTPPPLVLDCSVLSEIARADTDTIGMVLRYDAIGQPMVLPTLAITNAVLDTHTEEANDLLHGIASLQQSMVAPLLDAKQAARLATVIALTGLEVWEAHVAMVADASICRVLTYDAPKWAEPSRALEHRLHIVEIADPDEGRS